MAIFWTVLAWLLLSGMGCLFVACIREEKKDSDVWKIQGAATK